MKSEIPTARWTWLPPGGHQLRKAGVHFDAVRISGRKAEAIAALLEQAQDGSPGPVIQELTGYRWLYFLLPPGAAAARAWPYGVQRYTARTRGSVAYVGVPALAGETWPLGWRCVPTADREHLDAELLHRTVWGELGGVSPQGEGPYGAVNPED